MVTKLRSFKRTGVFEFFVIRLTAAFQALYFLVISFYWFQVEAVNFVALAALFENIFFTNIVRRWLIPYVAYRCNPHFDFTFVRSSHSMAWNYHKPRPST